MAIDLITVHATATDSYGFTMTFVSDSDEPYLRQAPTGTVWSHEDAVKRALAVADLYNLTADEVAGIDKPANRPVVARHDGHVCTYCGKPIPATGGRGRPRKIHAECQAEMKQRKADSKPGTTKRQAQAEAKAMIAEAS
jgi:hypothetical protein